MFCGQGLPLLEKYAVVHLLKSSQFFDVEKGELDNSPQDASAQTTVDSIDPFSQYPSRKFLENHESDRDILQITCRHILFIDRVDLVAMYRFFLTVQQCLHDLVLQKL